MVEYAVKHDINPVFMERTANLCEVFVCAEPAVNLLEITGVITMVV